MEPSEILEALLDTRVFAQVEDEVGRIGAKIGDVLRVAFDVLNAGQVIGLRAREVRVQGDHSVSARRRQGLDQVGADETGAAGNENGTLFDHESGSVRG